MGVLVIFLSVAFIARIAVAFDELTIAMPLDHFSESNNRRWPMRYYADDSNFVDGAPLFVLVTGGSFITPYFIEEGYFSRIAAEVNGYIVNPEPRFYGISQPFGSLTTANLQYFTIDQTIADLKYFIENFKSMHNGLRNSTVIAAGFGEGGSLASWLRQKHPDLVKGAWASSAPVKAIANFQEFNEGIERVLTTLGSSNCSRRIHNAFQIMNDKLEAGELNELKANLNLCYKPNTDDFMSLFLFTYGMSRAVGDFVILNTPPEIANACNIIGNKNATDDFQALATWIRRISAGSCLNFNYDQFLNTHLDEDASSSLAYLGVRQFWFYMCNEIGWFRISMTRDALFGDLIQPEGFVRICQTLFDERFTWDQIMNNTEAVNRKYGGSTPQVSNVLFVYAELAPLTLGGVTNSNYDTIIIPGRLQTNDFFPLTDLDEPPVREAKLRIRETILRWLAT